MPTPIRTEAMSHNHKYDACLDEGNKEHNQKKKIKMWKLILFH